MKIRYTGKTGRKGYALIRENNIENDGVTFTATYRGFYICITKDHGHGKAAKGLTRYDIVVMCKKDNSDNVVDTFKDLPNLRAAVKYALYGAGIIRTTDIENEAAYYDA